ncbi:MAG: hypothetical protein QM788_01855 [Roseateles sp.]|uniref:hypothetical protein n=1 Tax=Roseateles sp. TaxID=1971397 RepID=UPI0039EC5BDF
MHPSLFIAKLIVTEARGLSNEQLDAILRHIFLTNKKSNLLLGWSIIGTFFICLIFAAIFAYTSGNSPKITSTAMLILVPIIMPMIFVSLQFALPIFIARAQIKKLIDTDPAD